MNSKRWIAAAAGAAAAAAAYAFVVEPRWLQLRRVRIHVRDLPPALEGLRIGLLTDLHADPGDLAMTRRAVRRVMDAEPDLVALTGDFAADDAPGFGSVFGALSPLEAPLGVYAVPGNHDYHVGIDAWRQQVGAHPRIVDLTNRCLMFRLDEARLCVAGVDDYYEGRPRLRLPPPSERDATILLAHSPDQAERCRRSYDAVDLIVSGHTHAGQVRLPFLGAPVSAAENPRLYEDGVRRRPWTQVYTSRGVGTVHLPIRFFARPEVSVLDLTASPRPPLSPLARLVRRLARRPGPVVSGTATR